MRGRRVRAGGWVEHPLGYRAHRLQTGTFKSHLRHHCLVRFTAGRARGDAPEQAVSL